MPATRHHKAQVGRSDILARMPNIGARQVWEEWLTGGEYLPENRRGNRLLIERFTDVGIRVSANNNHRPLLRYKRLDALWQQRDRVSGKPRRNKLINAVWKGSDLGEDNTNESYYWAVVCARARREAGLLGLDSDFEAAEGNQSLVQHLQRERERSLVNAKKNAVLKATGKLVCEICGFNFEQRYQLGPFCEVHHKLPLAQGKRKTKPSDLAIVCSNCHRMIHKTNWSIEEFREHMLKLEGDSAT